RGEVPAQAVLFPGGSTATLARVYASSPLPALCNEVLADVVARFLAGRGPEARVLEAGAGTGATARRLLPRLAGLAREYVCTDVAGLFLETAGRALAGPVPVRTALFDLERPPAAQGL